jgi:hypothetical protein
MLWFDDMPLVVRAPDPRMISLDASLHQLWLWSGTAITGIVIDAVALSPR